jgi:hypothetical protein
MQEEIVCDVFPIDTTEAIIMSPVTSDSLRKEGFISFPLLLLFIRR